MTTLVMSGTGTKFQVNSKAGKGKINVLTSKGIKTVSIAQSTNIRYAA